MTQCLLKQRALDVNFCMGAQMRVSLMNLIYKKVNLYQIIHGRLTKFECV